MSSSAGEYATSRVTPTGVDRGWAWIVALASLAAASGIGATLVEHGVRVNQVYSATFFVGLAGGIAWQLLSPRDVVDRFFAFTLFGTAMMALVALPGISGDFAVDSSFGPFGAVAGVVLGAGYQRPRRD